MPAEIHVIATAERLAILDRFNRLDWSRVGPLAVSAHMPTGMLTFASGRR